MSYLTVFLCVSLQELGRSQHTFLNSIHGISSDPPHADDAASEDMARECVDADYATHAAAADFRDECVRDTERDIIDIQASSNGHSETKRVMELGLGLGPIS